MMTDRDRRAVLAPLPNPSPRRDMLIALEALPVRLFFVPDRLIVNPDSFAAYCARLPQAEAEQAAERIIEDFSNEVVPRWVQVRLIGVTPLHWVCVEDCQPHWRNPSLLAQLPPLA